MQNQVQLPLSFIILGLFLNPCRGQDFFDSASNDPHLTPSLVSETKVVVPGESFWVAARLKMDEGWHAYWKNPGAAGAKPEIDWDLPEGFSAGQIQWPAPERHILQGLMNYVYEKEVFLMVEITPPMQVGEGSVTLKANVSWTVCSDKQCLFGDKDLTLELPVGEDSSVNDAIALAFEQTRKNWPQKDAGLKARALYDGESMVLEFSRKPRTDQAGGTKPRPAISLKVLWMAFIGGAILNLMPCVFPVIGLKIMGFVNQAGEDRRQIAMHGFVYTGGVLVSYWILAGILIVVGAGGKELGWGFQLQDPRFVFVLTMVLFIFALNLSGLFEVGASLM